MFSKTAQIAIATFGLLALLAPAAVAQSAFSGSVKDTTGAVLAMVGGRHDVPGGFNRAFQAQRQPGSAMKAIVYAAALDPQRGGRVFGPASTMPDLRREFPTPQGPWRPQNDEGEYHPQVTLAKALAKSLNVATANLVEAIGPRVVARYADRFGLRGIKPLPSIGLGTSEVSLVALTKIAFFVSFQPLPDK